MVSGVRAAVTCAVTAGVSGLVIMCAHPTRWLRRVHNTAACVTCSLHPAPKLTQNLFPRTRYVPAPPLP